MAAGRRRNADRVRQALAAEENPLNNVRNMCVIAHVDAGKSTLTDALLARSGLLNKNTAGRARGCDTREDEAERGVTIKATAVSMCLSRTVPAAAAADGEAKKEQEKQEQFVVNLIDSPGHADFSSEVTAALRVTDGAMVVVDAVEGVQAQTETVLRQALAERIKPVLFCNKVDRLFLELQKEPEEIYRTLLHAIGSVNARIQTYADESMADIMGTDLSVCPVVGSVAFGSGLQGWGFTLAQVARDLCGRFRMTEEELLPKLWGDHFFDRQRGKWSTRATRKGRKLERGFCVVIDMVRQLITSAMEHGLSEKDSFASKFSRTMLAERALSKEEVEMQPGKMLAETLLKRWMPVDRAILDIVVDHLPSPVRAQPYRAEKIYDGPHNDATAEAIRKCDPNGPLVVFVSKMVPEPDFTRFRAIGRVFSGTIRSGMEVRVQTPDYRPPEPESDDGDDGDEAKKPAQQRRSKKASAAKIRKLTSVSLVMAAHYENIGPIPNGCIAGISGLDNDLIKCGTLVSPELRDSHNFKMMKYSVSPVVRVAVECKQPAHLARLVEGLRRLAKSDPLVEVSTSEDGEHVVAGCGDLHLEVCLQDLQNFFVGKQYPLVVSRPVVKFSESAGAKSSQTVMGKSANKFNKLHMTCEPLDEELVAALEAGELAGLTEKERTRVLVEDFGWESAVAKRVWVFGPAPEMLNVLVDQTRGVQYLQEARQTIIQAFHSYSAKGVLTGEALRGVRFNLVDAQFHPDSRHRGAGQVMPALRKAMYAAQLVSEPVLLEPVYEVEISVDRANVEGACATLRARRGEVTSIANAEGQPNAMTVKAALPVRESFGFATDLHKGTHGRGFPSMTFSHWQSVPGALKLEKSSGDDGGSVSMAQEVLTAVRARKGMKEDLPQVADFHSKA